MSRDNDVRLQGGEGQKSYTRSVDLVVGTHHRERTGLYRRMKGVEVYLPLRAFVHDGADQPAVVLLVVVHEVLHVGDDTLSLYALHYGSHHQAAEERILARQVPAAHEQR